MEQSNLTIGIIVDKTWAFIPSDNSPFLCLFQDGNAKYLFLVKYYRLKQRDGVQKEHFSGMFYHLPPIQVIKKIGTSHLFEILTQQTYRDSAVQLKPIMEVKDVPLDYVSSLEKYVYEHYSRKK